MIVAWIVACSVGLCSLPLSNGLGLVRFAKKISQNTIPADLLWEKNIVPAEKTSWKRRIIGEAIMFVVLKILSIQ